MLRHDSPRFTRCWFAASGAAAVPAVLALSFPSVNWLPRRFADAIDVRDCEKEVSSPALADARPGWAAGWMTHWQSESPR
jgi:hypothetical protein